MLKSYPQKVFLFCSVTLCAVAVSLLDLTSPAFGQTASQPSVIILKEIKLIGRKTPPAPPPTQGSIPPTATSNIVILKEIKLIGRKTPPKPPATQGNSSPTSTSNIITLKEIKLIGRKGQPTQNKKIDIGTFKIVPKAPLRKTTDIGTFKIVPKKADVIRKTTNIGSFKIVPKVIKKNIKKVQAKDIILNWVPEPVQASDALKRNVTGVQLGPLARPEVLTVTGPSMVLTGKNALGKNESFTESGPSLVLTGKNALGKNESFTESGPSLVLTGKNALGKNESFTERGSSLLLTGRNAPQRATKAENVPAANVVTDGNVTVVDIGELKLIGEAEENKFSINGGELRAVGDRSGRKKIIRPDSLPGRVKVSVIRVRKLSGTTNPFDPVEVEEDVTAAQNGTLDAGPLTAAEVPTGFSSFGYGVEIRAGSNFLGQFTPGNPADPNQVFEVLADTPTNTIQYLFGGGNFAIISHNAPVTVFAGFHYESTPNTPVTFVVRRVSDNRFFQITVTVAAAGFSDANITQLSGFDCGKSVSGCP